MWLVFFPYRYSMECFSCFIYFTYDICFVDPGKICDNFSTFYESNFQPSSLSVLLYPKSFDDTILKTQNELEHFRESSSFKVFFSGIERRVWSGRQVIAAFLQRGPELFSCYLYWRSSLPTSDGILPSWSIMSRHEVCYDEWMATSQIYWFRRETGTAISESHDLDECIIISRLLFRKSWLGWVYHEFETVVSWSHDLDGCFVKSSCFLKSSFFKEIPFISLQVPLSFNSHLRFWFLYLQTPHIWNRSVVTGFL